MADSQTHTLTEPIEVQLPGYQMVHRVLRIEVKRNPELRTRKKFVYAIAQWRLERSDRWHALDGDLVTQMRLANASEQNHPFPRNTEGYANAW